MTAGALANVLAVQRDACAAIGSDVYARLLQRSLERIDRPGPLRDLLVPHAGDPLGSALALRFLASLHRVVLEGRAPALAAHRGPLTLTRATESPIAKPIAIDCADRMTVLIVPSTSSGARARTGAKFMS